MVQYLRIKMFYFILIQLNNLLVYTHSEQFGFQSLNLYFVNKQNLIRMMPRFSFHRKNKPP